MGIFTRFFKPKIQRKQWLEFAFNQLLSDEWEKTRKKLYVYTKNEKMAPSNVTEEIFLHSLLGSLLELLTFVTTNYDKKLGWEAHELRGQYISDLKEPIKSVVQESYENCNQKVGELIPRNSGFTAIALGLIEHLGLIGTEELKIQLELEFQALANVWIHDMGQYHFIP